MKKACFNCARCSLHYPSFRETCDINEHEIKDSFCETCEQFEPIEEVPHG